MDESLLLTKLRDLLSHAHWADERILQALKAAESGIRGSNDEMNAASAAVRPAGEGVASSGADRVAGSLREAVREQAHVVGATEVWLSRLESREARCSVWPAVDLPALERLSTETHAALDRFFDAIDAARLDAVVTYVNSAGKTFTNTVADILLHAFTHGQYHRGKVNALLRLAALDPAPVDYIAFVRGTAAATEADAAARGGAA